MPPDSWYFVRNPLTSPPEEPSWRRADRCRSDCSLTACSTQRSKREQSWLTTDFKQDPIPVFEVAWPVCIGMQQNKIGNNPVICKTRIRRITNAPKVSFWRFETMVPFYVFREFKTGKKTWKSFTLNAEGAAQKSRGNTPARLTASLTIVYVNRLRKGAKVGTKQSGPNQHQTCNIAHLQRFTARGR